MRTADRGFTLLEILLASALSVVMLLGLWSLLSLHVRLFTKAPAGIEQSQLIRSLAIQLSDDLASTMPTPTGDSASTSRGQISNPGSIPSALFGTQDTLQVVVLRANLPEENHARVRGLRDTWDAPQQASLVGEVWTVLYCFTEPTSQQRFSVRAPAGLIRREWPWGTPAPVQQPEMVPDGAAGKFPSRSPPPTSRPDGLTSSDAELPNVPDEATNVAPEVVGLEFRYFDGTAWSSWWESRERRSLPVAVEVRLFLRATSQRNNLREPSSELASSGGPRREPEGRRVRMVFYLPASTRQPSQNHEGQNYMRGEL